MVVRKLLTLAPLNPGNRLEVGGVSGNFLRGLTLEDVRLRQDGRELAYFRQLTVGYHLPRLRPPVSRLDELAIDGGRIAAARGGARAGTSSTCSGSRPTRPGAVGSGSAG